MIAATTTDEPHLVRERLSMEDGKQNYADADRDRQTEGEDSQERVAGAAVLDERLHDVG